MFQNRAEAGRKLGEALEGYRGQDLVVLGLARGGVPVAFEVAQKLGASLDVLVVRKLGVPIHPEFGFGAIAPGTLVVDNQTVAYVGLTESEIDEVVEKEKDELERRIEKYRGGRREYDLKEKTVILVDDGIATGVSMKAAIKFVASQGAKETVLAVPVCAKDTYFKLKAEVDKFISLLTPEYFGSVGEWYEEFGQTSDAEVINLLERSKEK